MLTTIINVLFALTTSDADAAALQRTAPEPITLAAARDNIVTARLAAAVFDVDADIVLSIAAHESRYESNAATPEPGGRWSCGIGTPQPHVEPCHDRPLLDQYLELAGHLREWLDAERGNLHAALLGYAGGGEHGLVGACRVGPVIIRPGVDACDTPAVFMFRAAWIARERRRAVVYRRS